MTSEELKELQAPLKEKYRESPEDAKATLIATGKIDVDGVVCQLQGEQTGLKECGLHPMTGGDGTQKCAAEMLLEALIGCAGVTFGAVCTAMGIGVQSATIRAEGDLDFRGTLGVSREVPIGFESVRLIFEIQSDAEAAKLDKAVELAERYCVVAQTLKQVEVSRVSH